MLEILNFLPRRWWSVSAWKKWRAYMHWRLETYGVYFPKGEFNRNNLFRLFRQLPGYLHWLSQFSRLRK